MSLFSFSVKHVWWFYAGLISLVVHQDVPLDSYAVEKHLCLFKDPLH